MIRGRVVYQSRALLAGMKAPVVVQAWFQGMNPQLAFAARDPEGVSWCLGTYAGE